jgi:hypothetical protein
VTEIADEIKEDDDAGPAPAAAADEGAEDTRGPSFFVKSRQEKRQDAKPKR